MRKYKLVRFADDESSTIPELVGNPKWGVLLSVPKGMSLEFIG